MSSASSTGKPVCPVCNDTGWMKLANDPRRVTRCECQVAARAQHLMRAAHPRRYEHCDFDEFVTFRHPSHAAAKLVAQKYVAEYDPVHKSKGLLLIGPIGTGKTHLAVSILKELVRQKGVRCLFVDYRELLKDIQNSYNPSVAATEMEILRPVMETEVLLLDELGAVKPSDWVWDTVSLVLNTRYNDDRTTTTINYADLPARDSAGTEDRRSPTAARRAGAEHSR